MTAEMPKPPNPADSSGARPPGGSPRTVGLLLIGAMALLVGLGMILVGVFAPMITPPPPSAPSVRAAPHATGARKQLPADAKPTPLQPPTPPAELRAWPGRLAIFSDTAFSDGRPMELVQPLEWQPVLSLADRGIPPPNRFAQPNLPTSIPATARGQALPPDLRIYLSYSRTGQVLCAEIRAGRLTLLQSTGDAQPMAALTDGALVPVTPDPKGIARTTLRFQFRDGRLAVLQDGRNLCATAFSAGFQGGLAYQTGADSTLVFGDFDLFSGGDIVFRDDFMRADSDGFWKADQGAWELEALTFPERSSNPFALKAVFSDRTEKAEIDRGRDQSDQMGDGGSGAGIQPNIRNGRISVARITGDGPAARAGLMEEDIILALNGRRLTFRDMMFFFHELREPTTGQVDLEILRPGENQPRHILFTPGEFHWADVRLRQRLPGSAVADTAAIVASHETWQAYHALCALRFLSGGGGGMVLGYGRPGAVHLRWYGANRLDSRHPANEFQIVQTSGATEKILFRQPLTPWRDTFYRLHADTTGPDLKIYLDEVLLATLPGVQAPTGPIALWAAKTNLPGISAADDGVFFDDVEVVSDPAQVTTKAQLRVNRIMKNEQDMKQWANPSHEWWATCAAGERPVVQYHADLPGRQSLLVKTPQPTPDKPFSLYLGMTLPPNPAATPGWGLHPGAAPVLADARHARSYPYAQRRQTPREVADFMLQSFGTPLYAPPHASEYGVDGQPGHFIMPEENAGNLANDAGQAAQAATQPLPPIRAHALEWRWTPVAATADTTAGWRWTVLDPRQPEPLAAGAAAALPDALALVSLPGTVVARVNGVDVATIARDLIAPIGQSAAVSGLDNWPDDGVLAASADQVLEYTFNNAPDDWAVHAGRWGLLNKWVCDPRWSWFGGRSDSGLASIWHKQQFRGDITVDYYAALMMYRNDPPYERPGDFNCTIFGDGVNQGSGYSLIFGGGDNRWSALTRNGRTAAWIINENARLPSDRLRQQEKADLHQRWFHLQLRRVGDKVSYSLDGTRWLEFTDPDPIPAGRVALWTVNNGYLLARVRIAYQHSDGPVIDQGRTTPHIAADPMVPAQPSPPAPPSPPVVAEIPKPPAAAQLSFLPDPTPFGDEWTQTSTVNRLFFPANEPSIFPMTILPHGSLEARQSSVMAQPGTALTVTSPGGGPIALGIGTERRFAFDRNHARVRFWFRADPGASVDLYFRTQRDNFFRLRLTGPVDGPPGAVELGDCGAADLADGRWHLLDLDLLARYEALMRDRFIQLRVSELDIVFGALSPCDGQLWGARCNAAGVRYEVADFEVLPAAAAAAQAVAGELEPDPTKPELTRPGALLTQPDPYPYATTIRIPLNSWAGATIAEAVATLADGSTHPVEIGATAAITRNANGCDWSLDLLRLRPWLGDPQELQSIAITWQWHNAAKSTEQNRKSEQETITYACRFQADPLFRLRGLRMKPALWLRPTREPLPAAPAESVAPAAAADATPPTAMPPADATTPAATPPPEFAWQDAAPVDIDFGAAPGDHPAAAPPPARNAMVTRTDPLQNPNPFTGLAALRVEPRQSGQNWGLGIPLTPDQAAMQNQAQPRSKNVIRLGPGGGIVPNWVRSDGRVDNAQAQAFWLARYPLLRIDHRTPFETPVNLRAWAGSDSVSFMLTDRWAPFTWYLDDPAEFLGGDVFVDDGHWRSDLYDWRAVWQQSRFDAHDANPIPHLQDLQLIDNGWPGARKGMFLEYGRVQTVLAARPDEFGVRLTDLPPGLRDGLGVVSPALQLILAPHGPGQAVTTWYALQPDVRNNPQNPAAHLYSPAASDHAKIAGGVYWVYAVNAAEWQATVAADHPIGPTGLPTGPYPHAVDSFPVLFDADPPQIAAAHPANGSTSAATVLHFRLTDANFLRADTLRLKLNDRELSLQTAGVTFEPTTQQVTIDWLQMQTGQLPSAPTPVTLALTAAEDALGNRLDAPRPVTQFTFDPGLEQPAPTLAQWRCSRFDDRQRTALDEYRGLLHDSGVNSFEFLPGDGSFRGAGTRVTLTADNPSWGRQSLRARIADPLGEFHTTLFEEPWFLDDRPILTFDYRATPEAELQLELEVDGRRVIVPLEGPQGRLLADGLWQHVAIDLERYVRARCPDLRYRLARKLRIVQGYPRKMIVGAGVDLDNLAMLEGPRVTTLQLRWQTALNEPPARVLADVNTKMRADPTTPLAPAETTLDVPPPDRSRAPVFAHLQATARNGATGAVIHLKLWDLDLPLRRAKQLGWLP